MTEIYSDQLVPDDFVKPAIFLAGPTPRLKNPVPSWRPDALKILRDVGFEGTVFIPEYSTFKPMRSYTEQVEWEWAALHSSATVVFWVPRDLETMPAFTTNVEFGYYLGKQRVVYGRPDNSPKNTYLDWLYNKVTGKIPYNSLQATMEAAVEGSLNRVADLLQIQLEESWQYKERAIMEQNFPMAAKIRDWGDKLKKLIDEARQIAYECDKPRAI